jgi:hypothetical protein
MDYTTWLTKQQVAERLQVGIRTVETLAQTGQLHQARRRAPDTGQRVAVYHPDDVDRIAAERAPGPPTAFLVPDPTKNGNGHGHAPSQALMIPPPPAGDLEPIRALTSVLLAVVTELRKEGPQASQASQGPQTPTTWIEIPEAARILGRSQAYVRRQIQGGFLHAERDRTVKVRRTDVEAL